MWLYCVLELARQYNSNDNLTEIAFIDCPVPVPRQVFKAIRLCLPFHPKLTRLTFKGKHLDCGALYEISEMLPFSNLTDVVLDNSYVPQGYYYVLLEQASTLKYLSLSNCGVDDIACEKIAKRIRRGKPAAEHLLVLNLSINSISDVGAKALGRSLRANRRLLHLNLCNNSITSVGAAHILLPLTEFQLNDNEKRKLKESKCEYVMQKVAAVRGYLKDITNKSNVASATKTSSNNFAKKKSCKSGDMRVQSIHALVDKAQNTASGACLDTFCSNTVYRKGSWFSLGNLTLCSLNLAYNQLEYSAVLRIADVLTYQCHQEGSQTGLLRVVIEGNNLPSSCEEYDLINQYLEVAQRDNAPKSSAKKPASAGKRRRKRVKRELV